jgi:membrane fusion protein, multidrug efflux system
VATRASQAFAVAGVIVVGIALYLGVGAYRHHEAAQAAAAIPLPKVTVSVPVARELEAQLGLLGQFAAVEQVELRAQVGGTLAGIHFKDGDIVHKGDLLFTIDPQPYEIKLAQANASLETANARLSFTDRELKRAEELRKEEATSVDVVDQRTGDQQGALASVHAAQAQINDARFDLDHCRITAPFTGRIGTHMVSVGNLVAGSRGGAASATTLLGALVSVDPVYFNFDMSESDYQTFSQARVGSTVPLAQRVVLAVGTDTKYGRQGTLDFVDNQLDRSSGTLHARATVPNADHLITPGAFARVKLALGAKVMQLLVPDSSVIPDQSQQVVLIVTPDGTVTPKVVKTGALRGNLREVTSGLSATDRVIIAGLPYAAPGSKVDAVDGKIDLPAAGDLE